MLEPLKSVPAHDFFLQSSTQDNYRLLRVYAWYRALLACVLLALFAIDATASVLGRAHADLYGYTIAVYFSMSVLTLGSVLLIHKAPSAYHIFVICLIDIIFLAIITYCSGGIATGIGLLIFIAVAASSIFLRGQLATLLAALASVAIWVESAATSYWSGIDINPLAVALLGVLLFITSLLFQYLTRRITVSQKSAAEQAEQAATLQKLNEMIVQRMNTGIVALGDGGLVLLYNESAARLLSFPIKFDVRDSFYFSKNPSAQNALEQWLSAPHKRPQPLQIEKNGLEVQLNFARMENSGSDLILVFAEDTRKVSQQVQQLKLASLGRLTASIAHEVRNPLGAISHAAQLLGESESLTEADRRLSAIIQNHSMRVNKIIENVLRLSRREAPNPEQCDLRDWLRMFAKQYAQAYGKPAKIELNIPDYPVLIYFDLSQLEQVVTNLCANGLRYSEKNIGEAKVTLRAYIHDSLAAPFLDIADYGVGIGDKESEQIFEPFFTTDPQGTGLGLYIARELCLANQAGLDYRRTAEGLSCFQISFPYFNKMLA